MFYPGCWASSLARLQKFHGLYNTLQLNKLTATSAQRKKIRREGNHYVFHWDLFFENPLIYMELRRLLILGTRDRKWKPTIAHYFVLLLHRAGKLTRAYIQNIDGLLDRVGLPDGLPDDKKVYVHGNMTKVSCESCRAEMDFDEFAEEVEEKIRNIHVPDDGPKKSTPIECRVCGEAAVKPRTVLFGSDLSPEFETLKNQDLPNVDLLFLAGTSLQVGPANTIPQKAPKSAKRVIVNSEEVGKEIGLEYGPAKTRDDFFAQGPCEEVFLELIMELGWLPDLEEVSRGNLAETSVELIKCWKGRKSAEPNAET